MDGPVCICRVTPRGYEPVSPYDQEIHAEYTIGSIVTVAIKQMKNPGQFRLYWRILNLVYPNTEYGSAHALSDALQLYCGFGIRETVGGIMQVAPRGTSKMDKAEFSAFFDLAMTYIQNRWGIDVDKLHNESRNLMRDEGL